MLDWTGERFVPWAKEAALAYEHLHRYIWASSFVKDKRVLDLASGEGYGSNLLACSAAAVVGVDIDEAAVRHAAGKYVRPGLQFIQGSITDVPLSERDPFDVIVCFEALEHIEEHDLLLREVKRLLKPGGIFVVSTPNKSVYDGLGEEPNPFHVRELSFEEFNSLMTDHFPRVRYFGQRVHPGSSIWPIGSADGVSARQFPIEWDTNEFKPLPEERKVAVYFVAVASDSGALPTEGSVLVDHSNALLQEKDRALEDLKASRDSAESAVTWLREQVTELDKQIAELNRGLQWREGQVRDLQQTVDSQTEGLDWREGQVKELESARTWLLEELRSAQEQRELTQQQLDVAMKQVEVSMKQLSAVNLELAQIQQSRGWKLVLRLRALRDVFFPPRRSS